MLAPLLKRLRWFRSNAGREKKSSRHQVVDERHRPSFYKNPPDRGPTRRVLFASETSCRGARKSHTYGARLLATTSRPSCEVTSWSALTPPRGRASPFTRASVRVRACIQPSSITREIVIRLINSRMTVIDRARAAAPRTVSLASKNT